MEPPIRVETPQGVAEFPAGTPQEIIEQSLKAQFPAQKTDTNRPATPQSGIEAIPEPGVGERMAPGVRGAFVAGGAMVGGALGIPAGPAGMLFGSMGGAAGGELVFQTLNDAMTAFGMKPLPGFIPPGQTSPMKIAGQETGVEPSARLTAAVGEAATEGMFTGGLSAVIPGKNIVMPLMGKVFGVRGEQAKAILDAARRQGIMLSAIDVGGPIAKGFAKVIGIFPFTGGPLRTARAIKEAQVEMRVNQTLNDLAPTASASAEIGVDMEKAARGVHGAFRATSGVLYDKWRKAMLTPVNGEIPKIIPTAQTKAQIIEFNKQLRQGEILLEEGDQLVGAAGEFENFLLRAEKLPDAISYPQYELLQKKFEGFVDQITASGFDVKRVAQIKKGMEQDLRSPIPGILPEEKFAEIVRMQEDADTFFSNGIVLFQTPTAGKFKRLDKNIFGAGPDVQGSINQDELLKTAFNADSPMALKNLRELVDETVFKQASRAHLENAVAKSFKTDVRGGEPVEIFQVDQFIRNLGLVKGFKNREDALAEMLKGTGTNVKDLKELASAMNIMQISDPSSFLVRRTILGGVAGLSAVGGIAGPLFAAGAPATAVAVALMARHTAKILAEPKYLKDLTRSFEPELSEVTRRAMVFRLARNLGEGDVGTEVRNPTEPASP